jgi:competence protein ComEC
MGGRCAVPAAIAVWLGMMCGPGRSPAAALAALAALMPLALIAWRSPDRTGTLALVLALALAGGARGAAHHLALERARLALAPPGALIRIRGRVVEPPLRESDEPVAIIAVSGSAPPLPRGARVRVRLPAGSGAEWGDAIEALALLDPPSALRNPGGFDARAVAEAGGLVASGHAPDAVASRGRGVYALPRATAARWRRAFERRFAIHLTPESRELVVPLVVGDRSALSPALNARLRAAGIIHLLALSGLHVAWLAALARAACGTLGGGPRARALAGGLCALGYVALAGPLPSLARAAAGEALLAWARVMDLALDPLQALALSALALLAVAPGWSGDLGFQLSFGAVLGLVTVGPWLGARCGRWRRLAAPLLPTLSAQLTAMPLLMARFHAISWVGAFANLVAVPVSGLLLTAAWLASLMDCALPGAGAPWYDACNALAAALRGIATLAARAPGAMVGVGCEPGVTIVAGAGAALIAIAVSTPRDLERAREAAPRARVATGGLGATLVAIALLLASTVRPLAPPAGRWWLVALDVGQGDALALGFEDGWWLIDAGPRTPHVDAGESVTHDDGDHTGGADAVRRGVHVMRILAPAPLPLVAGPARRFGAEPRARGDTLRSAPPLVVLWPPRPGDAEAAEIRTDNGAVLVIEAGAARGRALLLADADSAAEASLRVAPGIALLKVAHHGSGSSSGAAFLRGLRAGDAVISCGMHNPFGHPDAGAVARLLASGARIHRTDREGALWFEMSDAGATALDWRRGVRAAGVETAPSSAARCGATLARPPARW